MRIFQIGSYYCESVLKSFNNSPYNSSPDFKPKLSVLKTDTVSFSGKNYGMNTIKNPTGHCGYCGAKVYTEKELDAMAREIMQLKGGKLQGKIRSVTEKLGNRASNNALSAKKAEVNKEFIEFFEGFAEHSSKNAKMSGAELLKKYYQLDAQKGQEFLNTNLHPLLKTLDHVVPVNADVDNSDSDLNLVEACWSCNHDIKDGMSFEAFNFTYPTIKDSMPKEKYSFATMQLLQSSPSIAADNIASSELIKVLGDLLDQENAAKLNLFSIRTKILKSKDNILVAVDRIEHEQDQKREEIARLESINSEHAKDSEYEVIAKRVDLVSSIGDYKRQLSELRQSHSRQSNSVQNWEKKLTETHKDSRKSHNDKNNSQNKKEIPLDEIKRRLAESEASRDDIKRQIDELSPVLAAKEQELATLNEQHPDVDAMRIEKTRLETLISAHLQLQNLSVKQGEVRKKKDEIKEQINNLVTQEKEFASAATAPEAQTPDQIDKKRRYIELESALSQIESSNQTREQKLISSYARPRIVEEIDSLVNEPGVVDYLNNKKHAEIKGMLTTLNSTWGSLKAQDDSITTQIVIQTNIIQNNTKTDNPSDTGGEGSQLLSCSLERVKGQINTLDSNIVSLTDELAQIPDERVETLPSDPSAYQEYKNLQSRYDNIISELSASISKAKRVELETESSDIEQRMEVLYNSDAKVFSEKNNSDYEQLSAQREQLRKGLQSSTSMKEKNSHQNKIDSVEDQIQELYEKDVTIFNRINSEKRKSTKADLDKAVANRASLLNQQAEIEKTIEKSAVIGDGFNQQELQDKIDQLASDIKRITEKTQWLEVPDKVAKIKTEISLMDQTITSLRQKINAVKLEDSET